MFIIPIYLFILCTILVYLLIGVFTFFGKLFLVNGVVYDFETNTAIENVTIFFKSCDDGMLFSPTICTTSNVKTNSQGKFKIKAYEEDDFLMIYYHPDYHIYGSKKSRVIQNRLKHIGKNKIYLKKRETNQDLKWNRSEYERINIIQLSDSMFLHINANNISCENCNIEFYNENEFEFFSIKKIEVNNENDILPFKNGVFLIKSKITDEYAKIYLEKSTHDNWGSYHFVMNPVNNNLETNERLTNDFSDYGAAFYNVREEFQDRSKSTDPIDFIIFRNIENQILQNKLNPFLNSNPLSLKPIFVANVTEDNYIIKMNLYIKNNNLSKISILEYSKPIYELKTQKVLDMNDKILEKRVNLVYTSILKEVLSSSPIAINNSRYNESFKLVILENYEIYILCMVDKESFDNLFKGAKNNHETISISNHYSSHHDKLILLPLSNIKYANSVESPGVKWTFLR